MLQLRGIAKSFGAVRAVSNLGFAVGAGEQVAMIGPNGAGKTTCFNLINGQLRPDAGEILLDGQRIDGLAPRALARRGVGRTFQVAATFGSMSVMENVQVALLAHARMLGSLVARASVAFVHEAREILDRTGISGLGTQPCSRLSYGDLKRVELAIALAGRPRLLLMDEPTSGMASGERAGLMRLVAGLAREGGIAVLFTEHDMDAVFRYADRVMVLAEGELIATGLPAAVRADPQVRRVYLGEDATHA